MATCRDIEGWHIVSNLREFDLTLCFEEGVILTSLLTILLFSEIWRICRLTRLPSRIISRTSRWRLWAKLVRSGRLSICFALFIASVDFAGIRHYRFLL